MAYNSEKQPEPEKEEDGEEEDDYLTMTFPDEPPKSATSNSKKETSLQRTARQKKASAERGRIPSKAERAAAERAAREKALATRLDDADSHNKGAQMLAKMGFVKGGVLGKAADARTTPIEVSMKEDRGGIGMESERKRKVREAAEGVAEGEKRRKVGEEEFRERNRIEREEKRAEGQMWGAMKVLEGLENDSESRPAGEEADQSEPVNPASEMPTAGGKTKAKKLRDVNVLYRPLLRQRLERDRDQKMRYELNNSLSTRNEEEDYLTSFDDRIDDLEDEDQELAEFDALSFGERRDRIISELREKYQYCFFCKFRYPDTEMDGCPGLTEDDHD